MDFIFGLIVGIAIVGVISIVRGFRRRKTAGVLRIDTSDPDGPYMFLELSEKPYSLMTQKRVCFKVDISSYISQK